MEKKKWKKPVIICETVFSFLADAKIVSFPRVTVSLYVVAIIFIQKLSVNNSFLQPFRYYGTSGNEAALVFVQRKGIEQRDYTNLIFIVAI